MKFCKGCGAQLDDNAQFCTSCGGVVEGGSEEKVETSNHYENKQALGYLLEAKDILLKMLVKPVSTVGYAINNFRVQSALMLSGIIAIINGLLSMWLLHRIASALSIFGSNVFGSMGSSYEDFGLGDSTPSMPYGRVFISSIILTLVCIGVISGVTFVASKLFLKSDKGFSSLLNVAVCSQVPYIVSLFAGVILSYVSITLSIIIMVLGSILAIVSTFEGIKESSNTSGDSAAFVTSIVYAISGLLIYAFYSNGIF